MKNNTKLYRAETNGNYMECIHCGGSVESWDVVGPDGRAISTASKEDDARDLADMLNEAHEKGRSLTKNLTAENQVAESKEVA